MDIKYVLHTYITGSMMERHFHKHLHILFYQAHVSKRNLLQGQTCLLDLHKDRHNHFKSMPKMILMAISCKNNHHTL